MLHPGVRGPRVLFGSIRRSFSGVKVYVICGWFQSILRWVISRSWEVNSVITIRVFIAARRLQVQSVSVQGLPGGVILIVQLLVLQIRRKGKQWERFKPHSYRTLTGLPDSQFKALCGLSGEEAVSGALRFTHSRGRLWIKFTGKLALFAQVLSPGLSRVGRGGFCTGKLRMS